jgi:copper transport protein
VIEEAAGTLGRRRSAALAAAVLVVLSMGWGSAPAEAHGLLTASTPADGASVEEPPTQVVLTFNEPPDAVLSQLRVLDSSGREVKAGRTETVPGEPTQLRLPLEPLAKGTYTVGWRMTSAVDGHTTTGSVAFGVGVPVAPVGFDGAGTKVEEQTPTLLSVVGRWLFYVGVVLMLGAAAVGTTVLVKPATISRRLLVTAWVAAATGVALTVLDQQAAARAGLRELFSSPTGHRLRTQGLAVGLAGVAVGWAYVRRSRRSLALVGLAAAAAMLARAGAGHANASSVRWFTVGVQWLHLVSVGVWIGGLVWLLVAVRRGDPGRGPGLARRFSTVAGYTLVVVVLSGVARALDEVGAWTWLFDTRFGVTLLVKLGLFAALVLLGALSRFRHVPEAGAHSTRGLRRVVRGEVAVAAGVLGATAVLAGLPPAATVAAASRSSPPGDVEVTGQDYGTSMRVRLVVSPGSAGPNRFALRVSDYDSGKPVAAQAVSLRFRFQGRPDLAVPSLELTAGADSQWQGTGSALSIEGRWDVTALVQTAADTVQVPMEVVTRPAARSVPAPADQRTCGEGKPDPTYSLLTESSPDPPRSEGTTFRLTVRQEGRVVSGARVCVSADMPGMQHPGASTVAREASAGRYDADLKFGMTGAWAATVTVAEPGKPVVAVPMAFEVT